MVRPATPPAAFEVFAGHLGLNQDFLWFASLLAWSFALMVWWRSPSRREAWFWLPAAAVAGVAMALIQFVLFNPPFDFFYDRLRPGSATDYEVAPLDPNVFADLATIAVLAAAMAAITWQGLARRGRRAWALAVCGVVGGAAGLHMIRPEIGGGVLSALALAGAVVGWPRTGGTGWRRAAVLATALVPAGSTVGPVAAALGLLQRGGPPTPLGALAATVQLVAAGCALAGLARELRSRFAGAERGRFWQDLRPLAIGGAIWLFAGMAFAVYAGRDETREVKTNRLRTVAGLAGTFEAAVLLRPEQVDLVRPPHASWQPGDWVRSEAVARGEARPLERELGRIVQATPFLDTGRVLIEKDGWWVELASSHARARPDAVRLVGRIGPDDAAHWEQGVPYIEEAAVPEIGARYFCRAPLRFEGRTVGWLEGERREFFYTMQRKWRTGPLLVTALGLAIGGIVTLQRRSQRERDLAERAAAVAAESSRIKTAFLAKVSHELRTPLQSILGNCELLQRTTDPAEVAQRVRALRQHGDLMLRLVNDLLDLSTIEAGAFRFVERPVQVPELVRQIVESLRLRAVQAGLWLRSEIDPAVPAWTETDPERLRQIVLNLLGNALKFTRQGGVDVRLRLHSRDGDRCEVELSIADTGPGIAAADTQRIFEPFARLELAADREGAGVGLALVAALARAAGGQVGLESDGRSGSTFRVRLPMRVARRVPAGGAPGFAGRDASLAGRRVLVADDNALVRTLFMDHLTDCAAGCEEAEDGEQALAALRSGRFDAVVLDLAMPKRDGLAVARELRRQPPPGNRVRIVGVSAHASPSDRARALEAGMDEFLTKPVGLDELRIALLGGSGVAGQPPATAELTARLREIFQREVSGHVDAVRRAQAANDWHELAAHAHWLKNSAAVLGDDRLFEASTALEQAAERNDAAEAPQNWETCFALLQHWLDGTARRPADSPPDPR